MAVSQNGWRAVTASECVPFKWITGRVINNADVITIFEDFCKWYDTNIENIVQAHSWGYAPRPIRGGTTLSNHASGTALDLNAPKHPLGKRGTFSSSQYAKIRAKLKEYNGVLRAGIDYSGRADEMHYEINAGSSAVKAVANKIRKGGVAPVTSVKPKPNTTSITITVKAGDSLTGLAAKHKTTVGAIVSANGLKNANVIFVGQKLTITGVPVKATPVKKPVVAKPKAVWPNANLSLTSKHTDASHNAWVELLSEVGFKDKDLGTAMQKWLRSIGYYKPPFVIDGQMGPYAVMELQKFLKAKGFYKGLVDGKREGMTVKAEIAYLNSQRKYL